MERGSKDQLEVNRSRYARWDAFTRVNKSYPEIEVIRFFGNLIDLLSPEVVVVSGDGVVDEAKDAANRNALPVKVLHFDSFFRDEDKLLEDVSPGSVGLAFVDGSHPRERLLEVSNLSKVMHPRGIVALHDSEMPKLTDVMIELRGRMQLIELATPRGLALMQPANNLWIRPLPF